MTLTIHLPADLERPLHERAAALGRPLEEAAIVILRDDITRHARPPVTFPRLTPGAYPKEELDSEEPAYQPVPFPIVGTGRGRFTLAGPLPPAIIAEER